MIEIAFVSSGIDVRVCCRLNGRICASESTSHSPTPSRAFYRSGEYSFTNRSLWAGEDCRRFDGPVALGALVSLRLSEGEGAVSQTVPYSRLCV